jgi:hypothetical protein
MIQLEFDEIYQRLCSLSLPVAYLRFNKPQELPFIAYHEAGAEIKGADNYNLYRDSTVIVELYTEDKDVSLERQLEALFFDTELEKQADTYLEDEGMHFTSYSFNTIQKTGGQNGTHTD